MQIFEVLELKEFPYMETQEIVEGEIVKDIINSENHTKVFLLVDHDAKRIWMWNGPKSRFKLQIFGGILARRLRQQLRLFYRVDSMNIYKPSAKKYQEILEKSLGGGRAEAIKKDTYIKRIYESSARVDIEVSTNIKFTEAIKYIDQIPKADGFKRKFIIVGGNVYTEEEIMEAFVQEEKISKKQIKLGLLNRGFTFFSDDDYSTRLIINDRKIQGIELYTPKYAESETQTLNFNIPIFTEKKFSSPRNINTLQNAFKIPNKISEEDLE